MKRRSRLNTDFKRVAGGGSAIFQEQFEWTFEGKRKG
jgi:hypothetical protein